MTPEQLQAEAEKRYDYDPIIHPDDIKGDLRRAFISGCKSEAARQLHALKWIKVEEQLPMEGFKILVLNGNERELATLATNGDFILYRDSFNNERMFVTRLVKVTHWMELPPI